MKRAPFYIIPSVMVLLSGCTTSVMSDRTAVPAENSGRRASIPSVASLPVPDPGVMTTRYELGAYRYPLSLQGLRQVAVERQTRVPTNLALGNHIASPTYLPASFDPLPKSVELEAELATQREMTTRMRTAQQAMVDLEQRARGQFETLVQKTQETIRLREELESARVLVQRREAELQSRLQALEAGLSASLVSEDQVRSSVKSKE